MRAIRPGAAWKDSAGQPLHAHGGGMLLAQGRMWWVGESAKVKDDRQHGVHCYSSEDLLSWRDEGLVLRNSDVRGLHGEPAPSGGWVVERPKLLFNARTGLFVLWFHLERSRDYRLNAAAVATCASPCGQFRFVHALRPGGLRSLDASVFQEGRLAYRVMDVAHKTVVIMRMSADYLNTTGPPLAAPAVGREAPVLFKWRGRYYLGTSGITWWAPNPSLVHEAPSLRGPWRALGSPFEGRVAHDGQSHADNSFRSQPNFVLTYPTLEGRDAAVWMADRWCPDGHPCLKPWCPCLLEATYVWLPLDWSNRSARPTLSWRPEWRPPLPLLTTAAGPASREPPLVPMPPTPPMPPPPPPSPPLVKHCEGWCGKNKEAWPAKCAWDTWACAKCAPCRRAGRRRAARNLLYNRK